MFLSAIYTRLASSSGTLIPALFSALPPTHEVHAFKVALCQKLLTDPAPAQARRVQPRARKNSHAPRPPPSKAKDQQAHPIPGYTEFQRLLEAPGPADFVGAVMGRIRFELVVAYGALQSGNRDKGKGRDRDREWVLALREGRVRDVVRRAVDEPLREMALCLVGSWGGIFEFQKLSPPPSAAITPKGGKMDSLFAKADAIQPLGKKRKSSHPQKKAKDASDRTLHSVAQHTSILRSFSKLPEAQGTYQHIANKKLRNELNRHTAQASRAKALQEDAEMLLMDEAGTIELEGEMERTWRVGQDEIVLGAGQEAAKGRREWKLDGGPYRARYTRNGRHLAIAGRTGHVATFDWLTGTLHLELQLQETCRDITFLHDQSHYAVAQKKYVFIYDRDGVELHCLKSHIEPTRLEFLPYHWLLASIVRPPTSSFLFSK
ncbi:hypothetical protein H0H81_005720 [Sphagnurus paluster]|uniref:Uncharacterized protein n=1 Tax=Sphagnurus paluster TaxID=117069 RepID=A0A9P7GEM2_9AGAR|nr:hypothetical protein H0H81_005720 [Sphagnurus paluster]